jgi:low temperature requirement protein LtrA
MLPRDPREGHRAASSLELFFDLVFVVAVSFAAQNLHHIEADGHLGTAISGYLLVFFAIWWAWVNFTWFATSFDTDDWLYRVTTIVQMAGVLVLAAGIGPAMTSGDFFVLTMGYVVMRLAMVSQWLRAAASAPEFRATAIRYAVLISIVQVLWVLRAVFVPEGLAIAAFLVLMVAEVMVPIAAERPMTTPWHTHHIAERYGLFTLIVLGEGLVASANAVIDAIGEAERIAPLLELAACGLVIVAALWWIYFSREQHVHITSFPRALLFGYGHYFVFAAAGALPAGIEVVLSLAGGAAEITPTVAMATVTVPVAVFVIAIWVLALRTTLPRWANVVLVLVALLVGASALVPTAALVATAVGVALIVVVLEVSAGSGRDSAGSNRGSAGSDLGSAGSHRGSAGSHRGSTGSHRGSTGSHRGSAGSHRGRDDV